MTLTLQHQFSAAGMGGLLKASPVTSLSAAAAQPATTLTMASEAEANTASAFTLLDSTGALLHPALRNVKSINIGRLFHKAKNMAV